jgi:hypothetical protein
MSGKKAQSCGMTTTRVLAISDPHCGHQVGLTPPDFNYVSDLSSRTAHKFRRIRKECWNYYANELRKIGTPDIVLANGDLIEGRGARSGGSELMASGMKEQVRIAQAVLEQTKCSEIYLAYGTAYHVSPEGEDREADLVDGTKVRCVGSHEFLDIRGHMFDMKHHVGSSSVPHGRATPLARDMVWNMLWNGDEGMQPLADITLRAHVHYYTVYGTWFNGRQRLGYTMPALQGMGSKYGARRCSGLVHFGFLVFDITKGGIVCQPHIAHVASQKATTIVAGC